MKKIVCKDCWLFSHGNPCGCHAWVETGTDKHTGVVQTSTPPEMKVDMEYGIEEFRCNVCEETFNRVTREGAPYWEGECPYCQHTGGHINTDYENNT